MAKHKIIWSEFAEWNLGRIYDYILSRSFSGSLARQFILKLIVRVEQLERFPKSGRVDLHLKAWERSFVF